VQLQILRLDPEPAVEACEQAVAEYPSVDRFISILSRAYEAVGKVDWPGAVFRRDIGWRALGREGRG